MRRWQANRHKLARRPHGVETEYGRVEGKLALLAGGAPRFSPEYESCRELAAERGVALQEIYEAARRAFDPSQIK